MPFNFTQTDIPEVILITPKVFGDARGFFEETYKEADFKAAGIDARFVQDNHSFSRRGVLRGMHWQKAPYTQGKLVAAITGCIWDVAVDIRKDSPTFGKWTGHELSEDNHAMLWVPPGFAHGFVVLSETAHFTYKCTDVYAPEHEANFRWNDPEIGIDWPLNGIAPCTSGKDESAPLFKDILPL